MTNVATVLQLFWSGFGIPAFPEGSVPDTFPDGSGNEVPVTLPYITYRLAVPEWNSQTQEYARVWYRSTSFVEISRKVDEIRRAIGEGLTMKFDGGFLALMPDDLFCQYMADADPAIKTAYISLILHVVEV